MRADYAPLNFWTKWTGPLSTTEDNPNRWVGFHGTSLTSARQIVGNNFKTSTSKAEWLGHGVYFFIEGLNEPHTKADGWARKRSWDPENRRRVYHDYAVLETNIETDIHLDLDDVEDQTSFEALRSKCEEKMRDEGMDPAKYAIENDCYLANFAMDTLELDALIRKEAILTERFQLKTRFPNCRIMCVRDPVKCILSNRIVTKGRI